MILELVIEHSKHIELECERLVRLGDDVIERVVDCDIPSLLEHRTRGASLLFLSAYIPRRNKEQRNAP